MDIELSSAAFSEGEAIPIQYTCDGANVSPPLRWGGIPKNSQSLAIICADPDAPSGVFIHWVIYNLPPIVADVPEATPATEELIESGALQGRNDFNHIGYDGPCPPTGKPHRYFFHLYALDIKLELGAGATKLEFDRAAKGHIIAEGRLMGTYKRGASRATS
ncbi:MAG: YbhB/YbcL family Raf kinase inhibitor-like protein [Chloracidobacterium sp.]|nr:YbhB/YbcL family Raf kinase inhibitor-like protein [Chloracidobacterium sp.]